MKPGENSGCIKIQKRHIEVIEKKTIVLELQRISANFDIPILVTHVFPVFLEINKSVNRNKTPSPLVPLGESKHYQKRLCKFNIHIGEKSKVFLLL